MLQFSISLSFKLLELLTSISYLCSMKFCSFSLNLKKKKELRKISFLTNLSCSHFFMLPLYYPVFIKSIPFYFPYFYFKYIFSSLSELILFCFHLSSSPGELILIFILLFSSPGELMTYFSILFSSLGELFLKKGSFSELSHSKRHFLWVHSVNFCITFA